jgi:DNA-binding CsgD family transcriptional regulator
MLADTRSRAIDKIARLAGQPSDLATFWRDCTDVVGTVVPHYWTPCWFTLDPASLLITSHFHDGLPTFPDEWLLAEYYGDDVNRVSDVAVDPSGISTLFDATGGNPASSPRWHANMTMGGDQELIAALRTASGEVWGVLGLYREPGAPMFDDADKAFVRAAAPRLAEGARRSLLVGEAVDPEVPTSPGLLMLSERGEQESATPGTAALLASLPDGDPSTDRLPSVVLALAGRVLRAAENPDDPGGISLARVRTREGAWLALHGACLVDGGARRVAVIVEPAHPARIYPLLMAAYRLTDRERDVTELVLRGASTAEIARDLVVSPHTVQQHLKSIFDKTGVRSRRDLVGKIFYSHYEARFRDNEQRVAADRPIRGGPASP